MKKAGTHLSEPHGVHYGVSWISKRSWFSKKKNGDPWSMRKKNKCPSRIPGIFSFVTKMPRGF